MKILHISTFQKGGAYIAALRLHQTFLDNGYDSKFLILNGKESGTVFLYRKKNLIIDLGIKILEKLGIPISWRQRKNYKIQKRNQQFELFSFATTPYNKLHEHPLVADADIINLHWVADFIDYNTFFKNNNKPIVWTLHDMYPFQGGFHYKEDEIKYAKTLNGIDEKHYAIKKRALNQKEPHSVAVVAPSKWLLHLSMHSEILGRFLHKHIPYGIDRNLFKLLNKGECKRSLGLPEEKVIVLFVAENLDNYRKGFDMVLKLVKDETINFKCVFVAVGNIKKAHQIPEIKYLGTIKNEKGMSLVYNAADIFILPSREDNLPYTMIESLCCGTPVVGFNIGGLKESISNHENGLLANNISVSELKDALISCIKDNKKFNREKISSMAHVKYASEVQLKAYLSLYNKCLSSSEVF